jgi:L-amino acid N-acyltransferase YncA
MSELDSEQLLAIYRDHSWDELDFLSYLREDFFRQPFAVYAVWVENEVYKSAVRLEQCGDGLLLHSLETAPGERKKGYAYNLLTHFLLFLQTTDHKVIYSHIDKRNYASLELHKKCGFTMYSDSAKYIDGTVTQKSCTMCYYL